MKARAKQTKKSSTKQKKYGLFLPLFSMAGVLLFVIALYVSQIVQKDASKEAGVIHLSEGLRFEPPRDIALQELYLTDGSPLTLNTFRGKWTLVIFGFLTCPDICPTNLSEIHKVTQELAERSVNLQVLYVTTDPNRDTVERLRSYLAFFDPSYLGVTGELQQLKALGNELGTFFRLQTPDSEGNYTVEHNSTLSLVGPDGQLVGELPGLVHHLRLKAFLGALMPN